MSTSIKTTFNNLVCLHSVVHTGPYSSTMRSIVFMDADANTYIWVTTAGQEYVEGDFYDISAECDTRGILKRVRLLNYRSKQDLLKEKSEQPDAKTPVDVFDLIFDTNDTHLTND